MRAVITHDQLEVQDEVLYNSGSIDYYEIDVEFTSDWDNLTKYAIINGAEAVKIPVVANKVKVDRNTSGTYYIGFVGYTIDDDKKTYQISTNLQPIYFQIGAGELPAADPQDLPDPTTWEAYLNEIEAIVNGAENVNITSEKIDDTTYITTTDKTGTATTTEIIDGKDAKINGVNTLTVEGGANVSIEQEGSTLTINATDTTDYNELNNKPSINGVELSGNKTSADLNIKQTYNKSDVGLGNVDNVKQYSANNPPPYPVTSVNGQTGAVVIDTHDDLIPTQASSSNQLADKNFVNSTVGTATATFRGTYNSLAELEQVTADENDYGFVVGTDTAGNTVYNRYKYASGTWVFEYALNNSSFTAAQWEAIQSGITDNLVTKLQGIEAGAEVNIVEGLKIGNVTQQVSSKIMQINPDTTPMQGGTNVIDSNAVYEVEKLLPTDRESGENVDIDNAQPYKVLDIVADGKYQQNTTTGANKFSFGLKEKRVLSGVSSSTEQDNNNLSFVTGTGTWSNVMFVFENNSKNTDYYLSLIAKSTKNISSRVTAYGTNVLDYASADLINLGAKDLDLTANTPISDTLSFNSGNYTYLAIRFWGNASGTSLSEAVTITMNNIMLATEQGATYEPYTNGASPNPNYPQTITQVTSATWNRTGKNLFDGVVENGTYNPTNGSKTTGSNYRSANYISVKPNTIYKFSINGEGKAVNILAYKEDKTYIGIIGGSAIAANSSFTTPNETKYITMFRGTGDGNEKWQIEEGSTATPYSPYQGQTIPIDLDGNEVCATDTIKDKLLVDRYGNVAIQKNVGKSILNGSEYWTTESQNKGYGVTIDNLYRVTISSAITTAISNQYKSGSLNSMRANSTDFCTYGDNAYFNKYDMTLEEFKTHISNNNLIIYYQLATPTIIPLPKLSVLPTTLKGINHIWVDTNLGRTAIEVEYVKDLSLDIPTKVTDLTDIGFDATKTQVLKNVQGTIQWVDE